MNGWLDDLSEDWPSQPPSLNASQNSRALGSSTSKLPRPTRLSGASSQASRKISRNTSNDSERRRSILVERSNNQSSTNDSADDPKNRSLRKSLSTGSVQSNVMYSTVEVRSQPASPEKVHEQGLTPEWKKRLLQGDIGYGQQKDLFGPSGIQSLFQKPSEKPENQKKSNNLSFLKHLETIPSSPPGIPRPMPSSISIDASITQRFGNLDILDEAEEHRDFSQQHISPSRSNAHQQDDIEQSQSEANDLSKAESSLDSPAPEPARQRITSLGVESGATQSRQTSGQSHNDSFSAVYISKHNTADGGIAYAPIDMSRSELAEQLALLAMSNNSQGSQQPKESSKTEDLVPEDPSVAHSEDLPTDLPVGTPDLISIGEFVTVRRGGYSDDGSFRRRPLSPSPLRKGSRSGIEFSTVQETEESILITESKPLKSQTRPTTPDEHAQQRTASVMNRFGENDLDSHSFPEEFSSMLDDDVCAEATVEDLPSRSPSPDVFPPGFQRPFKFRVESPVTINDTFKHKRNGSHVSSTGGISVAKRNSTKRGRPDLLHAQQDAAANANETAIQEGKRPPPSPYKGSTPKRRRTLMTDDVHRVAALEDLDISAMTQAVVDSHVRIQSIVKPKRKDSRVGSLMRRADPDVLSQRHILRPRNPTPSQQRHALLPIVAIQQASDDVPFSSPPGKSVGTYLDASMSPVASSEVLQENAIATELAAFSERITTRLEDGSRKTSFTTQDYLDEALKIMNFIRNKGRPASELSNVMESHLEDVEEFEGEEQDLDDLSDLPEEDRTFSRSPSHEYGKGGWRKRNTVQRSPSAIKHLEKFRESEDDDYMRSSMASHLGRQVRSTSDHIETVESDPPGLEIMQQPPHFKAKEEPNSNDEVLVDSQRSSGSDQTRQSQGSSESSLGRTSTSRKSETTVQTIRPDAVAPLIPDSVGLLVFDKEMKAWVRKPRDTTTSSPSHFGSIHTSEEDPFSDIPDLTIDADEEARRLLRAQFTAQEVDASTILKRHMEKGPTPENESRQNNNPQFNEASSVSATGLELDQNCPKRSAVHDTEGDALERSVILPRENVNEAEGDITELNEQAEPVISSPPSSSQSILVHSTARAQQEEDSLVPMNPIQHSLANSNVQIPSQEARPDTNSTISMGVNQKHTYESQSDMQNQFWMPNSVRTNATKDHKPAIPSPLRSDKTLTSSSKKPTMFSPDHNQNIRDPLPRTVQFSTAVAEYSASDIKPSSLDSPDSPSALNISSVALISSPFNKQHSKPPLITLAPPPDRSVNLMPTTLAPSSSPAPHHSTFLLSELSEFTVNQIDERELPTRALIKRHSGETVYENRFAWGDHLLIMALQNIYGSELFWEDLQEVDLQGQKLTSLNGLELVCPNVLELNVNDNELANLQGCPPSVINIMAANNRLTNISYFDMAQNLRILDVSNNHLTSLTPFNSLPNLQILKADDNQLKDINGLYNASMHLKELSLRRNRFFGKLEFQINAEELMPLKHLEQLDLSDNEISSISGIEHLASLKALKLSGNELKSFVLEYPLGSEPPLRELDISKNELTLFTIKGQTSNLFNLDISDNKLSANKIEIQYATFVQCFNVRKQTGSMDGFKPFVDKHSRINMLLMGSNKFSVLEPQEPFQNVQALDIANCKLSQFQPNLQRIFPHLVTLNASFNHIKDLEPLSRYEALETLLLAGNAITRLRASCNVARSCSNLRAVDFRQNPVTDGFYRENKSIVAPSTMTAASANAMAISRTAALSTLSVTQPAKIPPPTNSISMQPPPPPLPSSSSTTSSSSAAATEAQQLALQLAIVTSDSHGLPPQALDRQRDDDAQHVRSLESSLRARRRCWDLLLPARLVLADGLWRSGEFRRLVSGDDELFRRLVALAVVKRSVAWCREEEEDGLGVVSGRDE